MTDKEIMFLEVEKLPAEEIVPKTRKKPYFLKKNKYVIILKHPIQDVVINYCSLPNKIINCKDILFEFEERLKEEFNYESYYKQIDYSKFYITYTILDKKIFLNKLELYPSIKIFHSYNGLLKSQIIFGFFSKKYKNNMFGVEQNISIIPKCISNLDKFYFDDIINKINYFIEKIEDVKNLYKVLQNKKISKIDRDFILEIIKKTKFPVKTINDIEHFLKKENIQLDYWFLYLAFNYQLNFYNMKMNDEIKLKFDRKIFNYLLSKIL